MSTIINEIINQGKLDKDDPYYDMTLESYCYRIEKFYTDVIVRDMLRNLLVGVLLSGSNYYFNRFANLEYSQNLKEVQDSFCVYTGIEKEHNEDLDLQFRIVERKICKHE